MMDLPATQLINEDDDDTSSQSLNSSQTTPKRVHQVANLCIGDKKFPVFRGINKVGRNPGCDICINDLTVSKNHAEIEIKKSFYYICDLRSSNKTRINNEILRPDRFYQIVDGSKLTFGVINAQFLLLRDNNDSILVPETPAPGLKIRYDGNKSSITDSDDSVILGTQEDKDAGVFAKPSLPIRSPSSRDARGNKIRKQLNTSIHDIETQKFDQSNENNNPAIFDCETQKVNNSTSDLDKVNSIYDVNTQQLDDDKVRKEIFELETQKLDADKADVDESDIYCMSTQPISGADHKNRIYDLETQKIDSKTDEASSLYDLATQRINADDEDDDIYNCETQRINKQFEITISKVKKNRIPSKSTSVQKEATSVPQKYDDKKADEGDKKLQNVSTSIVEDSETDDELLDDENNKLIQSSSVHQSNGKLNSEITNNDVCKKSNDNLPSTSTDAQSHIIAETDDESETDDEEVVVNVKNNEQSKINNNNKADSGSETDDEEALAISHNNEQSKTNNDKMDNDSETDDENYLESLQSKKPKSNTASIDVNNLMIRKVDDNLENNACPSPVLVDFSKIQQPGMGTNDHDDETDDDEVYVTPNQLVSPRQKELSKIQKESSGLERYNTPPTTVTTEPANLNSPRNSEVDCDPDALTQIIPSLKNKSCEQTNKSIRNNNDNKVCEDSASTQLISVQSDDKFAEGNDDETDDEELNQHLPLNKQLGDKNNKVSVNNNNSKHVNEVDESAATQIVDFSNKNCKNHGEDTQKISETQRDDLEPTQIVDFQSSVSTRHQTNEQSGGKIENNDNDLDDLNNAPTQIINFDNKSKKSSDRFGSSDSDDDKSISPIKNRRSSRKAASSTPVSSSVARKKCLSGLKNLRVNLDKISDPQSNDSVTDKKNINLQSDSKKINHGNKTELNDDNNSHDDSITKNLDAMFGGSNDDELEDPMPLPTQQLEEILSDVPEKLCDVNNFQKSNSQDNKKNLRNKKICESRVDSRASTPDTQEVYFARLSSKKKKKSNLIIDSQGSSDSQSASNRQRNTTKEIVYAPGTAGFSNGVAVNSDESIAALESPTKKLKSNAKNGEKGLPKVRIPGTDSYPGSPISSSDSEDNYSISQVSKILEKQMAEIKAMEGDDSDGDEGVFNNFKKKSQQSKSKITGLKGVGSNNKKDVKKNNKELTVKATTSNVTDKKPVRKRAFPKKFTDGTFAVDKSTLDDDDQDKVAVPAKRSRKTRKISESNTSIASVGSTSEASKSQGENKKNTTAKKSKKPDVGEMNLLNPSVNLGPKEQKAQVEPKKKAAAKRPNKTDTDKINLQSTSASSGGEEKSVKLEPKKKTVAKRSKKSDQEQTNSLDSSTSSTVSSSSTLNSTTRSKRSMASSIMDSPSTSARSRHSVRPAEKMQYKIMFTGLSYEKYESAIQRLGGLITNDTMTGTILVTDKVRRTLKFICAISRSVPIVSEQWISASIANNKFVDTNKYILNDKAAEAKFGFNLQESLIKSKDNKLLHNTTFIITAGVNQPSVNELKNMIQVSGGKALIRAPKTWSPNTYIISCHEDVPKLKKLISSIPKNIVVPVVTTEFLLIGILQQKLNVEEHKLSF